MPSVVLYMASAVGVSFANVYVKTLYHMPTSLWLMASHAWVVLLYLLLTRHARVCVRPTRLLLLTALVNVMNVYCSFLGASYMSLAMFTALRRVSVGCTLTGELMFLHVRHTWREVYSLGLLMVSVCLVVAHDVSATSMGYVYVMVHNMLSAASALLTKRVLETSTPETVLVWSNLLQLFFALYMGSSYAWMDMSIPGVMVWCVSALCGGVVQYASTWCLSCNSALTLEMARASKDAVICMSSILHLLDTKYVFTWSNAVALQLTLLASFLYACRL